MNPWLKIWTKPQETIDYIKDSDWVEGQGLLPYFFLGINGAIESDYNSLLGESEWQEQIIFGVLALLLGIGGCLIARFLWINLIFFFGKMLRGQGSKRNIDSVLSLSLIPQGFILIYLLTMTIVNGDLKNQQANVIIVILCSLLTLRTLLIGLSRVQKFSYGFALLNIFIPQLILTMLIVAIRGLYY